MSPKDIINTAETTWLTLAIDEIKRQNLNPELIEVLKSFGNDKAPGPVSLTISTDDELAHLISTNLLNEVDQDQAEMFARRFASVNSLLQKSESTEEKTMNDLLRLCLNRRSYQILQESGNDKPGRALRIRALIDFIWSQSLLLVKYDRTKNTKNPTLHQLVQQNLNSYNTITDGFEHLLLEGKTSDYGPVHINILKISKGATTMKTVDTRDYGTTCLESLLNETGAIAAISGGFFLYSEPDIEQPSKRTDPVGLLVDNTENSVKINPPIFKRGALLQDNGKIFIDRVGMDGFIIKIYTSNNQTVEFQIGKDGVKICHRGHSKIANIGNDQVAISIVGNKVLQVCHPIKENKINVPLAGFVLFVPTTLNVGVIPIEQGNVVTYSLEHSNISNVSAAMAGGPVLLSSNGKIPNVMSLHSEDFTGSAPPVTFSQDETFDRNLLPRMGAGITSDGSLIVAAIDGRNLQRALGLTLRGTSDLLSYLGCVTGLNLDGGSSKRMVIRDKGVVCLHTTEIKSNAKNSNDCTDDPSSGNQKASPELSRPVYSAILFLPKNDKIDTRKTIN